MRTFLRILIPEPSRLRGRQHVVEPFRSDLSLQAIDKLRDEMDETSQPTLALGKLSFISRPNSLNAMDKTEGQASHVNAACTLIFDTVSNLLKYARTLKPKVIFKCCKQLRLRDDISRDAKLEQRSVEQIEAAQGGLPAAYSIARGHVARTQGASFERDCIRLRIDFADAAINVFSHTTDFENFGWVAWPRSERHQG